MKQTDLIQNIEKNLKKVETNLKEALEKIENLEQENDRLKYKIADAYQVMGKYAIQLGYYPSLDPVEVPEDEIERALDYFSHEEFNEDFSPWPQYDLSPEEQGQKGRDPDYLKAQDYDHDDALFNEMFSRLKWVLNNNAQDLDDDIVAWLSEPVILIMNDQKNDKDN